MNKDHPDNTAPAGNVQLLKNLRNYSRAIKTLTWQRQGILAAVALLTGAFFSPWKAALFFSIGMLCEYADLRLARRTMRLTADQTPQLRRIVAAFVGNTIVSTGTIAVYAAWVGMTQDGVGMFTALFCLFAASLYAAIHNHQMPQLLTLRLISYSAAFLVITARPLWVHRPPLNSDMWLQFFTILFVMYFVVDCSLGFLKMYRQDAKRLEDLEREHERAKEALVLKTQFVSVVSHELRTPLTSIKGALGLIGSGKFGEVPPTMTGLLDQANRNTHRLTDLVNDLLDLQKLEEGKMSFSKKTLELSTYLSEVTESLEGLAENYHITFELAPAGPGRTYIHTDPARLTQVLANIMSNAAKFSHDGSVVKIWQSASHGRVRIYVRDYGCGIPDNAKEDVFGRFTQVDVSDQRQFGGTGLGMNISREIMHAIGGSIDYESKLGEGTTFHIELPCTTVYEPGSGDSPTQDGSDQRPGSLPLISSAGS